MTTVDGPALSAPFPQTAGEEERLLLPVLSPEPLEDPTRAYLASLAPKSQRVVIERLRAVARLIKVDPVTMPWHHLRVQHIEYSRARLIEADAAPATVNLTLAALRGIARYARRYNLMTAEEYDRIRDVRPAKGTRLPAGRNIAAGELGALVQTCARDASPAGLRDAALLAVLYIGGMRRSEAAALGIENYTADPPTLRVRHGKGNKERLVPLTAGAAAALDSWVAWRGTNAGGLFLPINKGARIAAARLTSDAIYGILKKRAAEATIDHLSPHDFRRTFVGDLLDAGVNMSTVQQLAGHASVATTARYDRRGEATKRKAIDALHFPTPRLTLTHKSEEGKGIGRTRSDKGKNRREGEGRYACKVGGG